MLIMFCSVSTAFFILAFVAFTGAAYFTARLRTAARGQEFDSTVFLICLFLAVSLFLLIAYAGFAFSVMPQLSGTEAAV